VVPRRWSLVLVVVALATGCTTPAADRATPGPPPAPATTAAPTTTTTTTAPVAPDVADLMAGTTMTDRARRMFLAADPTVEDVATFARNCGVDPQPGSSSEPRTHTQGCYANGRIHLLAPDRPEAHDLLYVVAAHELLHAVYASLGPAERTRIDAELDAARAGNTRLEERLKPYGDTPTLINEVHSILGSEFEGLSPALEAHYAQFFSNRAAVVAARQRSLGDREDQISRLRADVDSLDARITELKGSQEQLKARGNVAAYNANVPVINDLIARYNAQIDALNTQIEQYNGLLGGG
jgi:hypothetical protein